MNNNVKDLPGLSNRGWRYTKSAAPKVQDEFTVDLRRGLYLWVDWDATDTPFVNASQLPPGDADDDEVISISLEHLIRAGGHWPVSINSNITGTLTFQNRGDLDTLNSALENYAAMLEQLAQEVRGLKVGETDLTESWDMEAWSHE